MNATRIEPAAKEFSEVLNRAHEYGIQSLEYEADLGHVNQLGSRLTDNVASRQDFDLWSILIDYRLQKDGVSGVRDILHGMRHRGTPVKLYTDDFASDHIWKQLLPLGLNDDKVMQGLSNPATGLARERKTLFLDTVGGLLRQKQVERAAKVARMLRLSHFAGHRDLLELFDIFYARGDEISIENFCAIYQVLPDARIYHSTITKLWEADRRSDAWYLHHYLLERHDRPTCFDDIEPFVVDLAKRNEPVAPFVRHLETAYIFFHKQVHRAYQQRLNLSRFEKDGSSSVPTVRKPRKLTDEFLGRAFATKSLSFEFVLKSLQIFEFVEVGPLAVREIAIRAGDMPTFRERLTSLENNSIDLGASMLVTVLRNLCVDDATTLFNDILNSDQHYEVLEDREFQRRLLATYYDRQDWRAVNRTLAVLSFGKQDGAARESAMRSIFRSAIIRRKWRNALQILSTMQRSAYSSTLSSLPSMTMSINILVDLVLSRKQTDRKGLKESVLRGRGRYLVGMLQEMEMSGIKIGGVHWSKALYFLGETHDIDYLRRTCMWLIDFYTHNADGMDVQHPVMRQNRISFTRLFDTRFQASIVEWLLCRRPDRRYHIRSLFIRSQYCMSFLQSLCSETKLPLDLDAIQTLFSTRVQQLFLSQETQILYSDAFDAMRVGDESELTRLGTALYYARWNEAAGSKSRSSKNGSKEQDLSDELHELVAPDVSPYKSTAVDENESMYDGTSTEATVVEYGDLFQPTSQDYQQKS